MTEREELSRDLSAYLDGELPPARAQRIEEVLVYDSDLADELRRLKATRNLLRTIPVAQPPADFTRHVLARSERNRLLGRGPSQSYASFRWVSLAAAAVVLIAVGMAFVLMTADRVENKPLATRGGQLAHASREPDVASDDGQAAPAVETVESVDRSEERLKTGRSGDDHRAKMPNPTVPRPTAGDEGFAQLDQELERMVAEGGQAKVTAGGGAGAGTAAKPGRGAGSEHKLAKAKTNDRKEGHSLRESNASKAAPAVAAKRRDTEVQNPCVVIYTSNIPFAQRDVEQALVRNGVPRRLAVRKTQIATNEAPNNYFRKKEVTVTQVVYEAFVTEKQLADVREALATVRNQQAVSQRPLPEATDSQLATARQRQLPKPAAPSAPSAEQVTRVDSVGSSFPQTMAVSGTKQEGDVGKMLRMLITLNLRTAPGAATYQAIHRHAATQESVDSGTDQHEAVKQTLPGLDSRKSPADK